MIKALVFDLDDTLIDRDATTRKFLLDQHSRIGKPLESVSKDDYADRVLKYQDHGYGDKLEAYRKTCAELGISTISAHVLLDDFDRHYGNTPVVPEGVRETLQQLSEKYTLALVTNSRTGWQNAKLDSSGLRPYFKEVLISEDIGFDKPDSRIFEHCIQKLGLEAHECVYIGDHPVNDVSGALNCGMKAFWFENPHFDPPEKADGIVRKISDLPAMIDALNHSLRKTVK